MGCVQHEKPAVHRGGPSEARSGRHRAVPHAAPDPVDERWELEEVMASRRSLAGLTSPLQTREGHLRVWLPGRRK